MSVPSPASAPYAEVLRESPWLVTLDRAYRFKAEQADKLQAEVLRLKVENETLKRRLRDAGRRQVLWKERQRIWQERERELLRKNG